MATKSTMSNQQMLIDMKRMLIDIKNIVIDLNKRNKLLTLELNKTKEEIIELNNRMPVRKQGLFGGWWEVSDNLTKGYENINIK